MEKMTVNPAAQPDLELWGYRLFRCNGEAV